MTAQERLSAELERALLRALLAEWHDINWRYFGRRLRAPTLALHDGQARLGRWDAARRELSLSRALTCGGPWAQAVEVLKHEVAHQFVHEVLGVHDESAHGPAFRQVCAQRGFDGAASGLPASGDGAGDPVLRRIAKLLALAGSPNQHEAEQAMRLAQRLMLQHNLDAVAQGTGRGYAYRQVGKPKGRHSAAEKLLAVILGEFFFVEVLWVSTYLVREGRRATVLELCGTPGNLDVAVWVHEFLHATGERLWRAHQRARGITADRDRREYLCGVMQGVRDKLRAGLADSRSEGLIWRGDPGLQGYFQRRHPRVTSACGASVRLGAAYDSGRVAGKAIVLSRPLGGEAAPPARGPRLLGPGH